MQQSDNEITELDSTLLALQGGLTSLAPRAAVGIIAQWQRVLVGAEQAELQQITKELEELKELLSGGALDGQRIGAVLGRLGLQTVGVAASAPEQVAGKLQQLGQLLSAAGSALSTT